MASASSPGRRLATDNSRPTASARCVSLVTAASGSALAVPAAAALAAGLLLWPWALLVGLPLYFPEERGTALAAGFGLLTSALGLPLEAIRTLLALDRDRRQSCQPVIRIAEDHLVAIDHQISELEGLKAHLRWLIDGCRGEGVERCPIMISLRE